MSFYRYSGLGPNIEIGIKKSHTRGKKYKIQNEMKWIEIINYIINLTNAKFVLFFIEIVYPPRFVAHETFT